MEKRTLGNSDLRITPIGFGAWAIGGGDWVFAWGAQDDDDSVAAIEHAVASGINWIDTAAVYGLGHSEEVVARALRRIGPANRPYVFTKCSLVWNARREVSHSLKSDSIRREVEESLRRLNGETIDLYQIHWATWDPEGNAPDIEEGWQTLKELKDEGKVREIGVSNFDASQLERIREIAPVASLQPPYSMLRRGIEAEILPYAKAHDIGVIVYSPMQSGLLTGKMTRERIAHMPPDDWRRGNSEFQEPKLTKNLALADLLTEIGARHDVSAGVVAIAWTLRHEAVTGAIVGARSPRQIDGIIAAGEFRLSEAEAAEIEAKL
ncbi:MAG TPA: aldo/keto reductase [Pyrinomonadaceae bacterium]|jgi:aryl-alcohol dehydrogenase-like predicted oxidoreductase